MTVIVNFTIHLTQKIESDVDIMPQQNSKEHKTINKIMIIKQIIPPANKILQL